MTPIEEIPELAMEKIIEFLDFKSVLSLRQVCRDFQNFIDDLKNSKLPDSKFTAISLRMENNSNIRLIFEDQNGSKHLFYSGNSRNFRQKTTIFPENSNIVDVAIRDLEWILKFQKNTFNWLYFQFEDSQLPFKLSNMLKNLNQKIKAKDLTVRTDSQSGIMSVLPYMDPEVLDLLYFFPRTRNMEMEMDQVVKTEQWRAAKEVHCDFHVLNMKIEDIAHFSKVFMWIWPVSARDMEFLRKAVTTSSKFDIQTRNFNEKEELSNNFWGPEFQSESSSHWYFRIRNSEERILRIKVIDWLDTTSFDFQVIEMANVPNGAIVNHYNF
ncbi:hypothetical protein B9Z55_026754 [Caenorhabditis nigoni]|uniref:F-box domain-containing protein n=1 Tax=Caenorhabditis nigoni TaxID=1611254 RepID=A0A2G5SHR9_9PELO|nr:hypothetical protein B9Z55_026754 [Caenorhabditis nigoni]